MMWQMVESILIDFLLPNRCYLLSDTIIYNHYKIIEECIKTVDESIDLDIATLSNKYTKGIEKVVLYSINYFNNQNKIQKLREILENS